MNVLLLSLFIGSSTQCEIAVSQTNVADGGLDGIPEMNTSTVIILSHLICVTKSYLRGVGDLFDKSSRKFFFYFFP